MILLAIGLSVFVLLYAATAAVITTAIWTDRPRTERLAEGRFPTVSVVVAARNEAHQITACLDAILNQDYPAELFEVIVVDDESQDDTANVVKQIAATDDRVHLASASSHSGSLIAKSRPLDVGIRLSSAHFIATTDGDCRPPATWLSSLVSLAVANDMKMVCGCTIVTGSSIVQRMQRLDWLNLKAIAAGLNLLGKPLTAMGNNMLFERQTYIDLGGYEEMGSSVTEDFLFYQMVSREHPSRVMISTHPESANTTVGEAGFTDLINQKARWLAGATESPPFAWGLFLVFLATHVSLLAALIVTPAIAFGLFTIKILADAAVIVALARRLRAAIPWITFPAYQLFQITGALILPLSLLSSRSIRWKSRQIAISNHKSRS